jgi:uncharacterized membrane protein
MDLLLIFMRLLHVLLGVFWAGTAFFNAFFLMPAMRDAGPDGAKVGAALLRRGMLNALPIAAVLTIVSGLWLYYRVSIAFQPAYMGSGPGMAYGIGAVAAILALAIGLTLVRPTMTKVATLAPLVATAPANERETKAAQLQALRSRAATLNLVVTVLVAVAAITMAIGRYV